MSFLYKRRRLKTSFLLALAAVMILTFINPVYAKSKAGDNKETGVKNTSYSLYVNRSNNFVKAVRLNAKGEEVCAKVMNCSMGRQGHSTPLGTFKTTDYYDWRQMVDGTYAQYAIRFNGHIMFHSVPYHKPSPDTLEWEEYNKLGHPASLGCVRLAVKDVKWIYDNCKKGTTVVVYDDPDDKANAPESIKIKETSTNRGWDPTDPDVDNPWND